MSRPGIPLPILLLLAMASETPGSRLEDRYNLPDDLPPDFKVHQTGCLECQVPDGMCQMGRTMLGKALMGPDFEIDDMPRQIARGDEHPDCCLVFRVKYEKRNFVIVKDHEGDALYETVEQIEAQRLMRSMKETHMAAFETFKKRYSKR